jgi:hypothetical protein
VGIFKTAKKVYENRKAILSNLIPKKSTIKTEVIIPDKKSVIITDFSNGSSIKTETTTSGSTGQTTTNVTHRGSGGSSVTPAQATEMDLAKAQLDNSRTLTPPINQNKTVPYVPSATENKLSALREENKGKESVIVEQTNSYVKNRFSYYQDLVNKRKMDIKEANYRLKSDAQVYQQKLIDAENIRRDQRYNDIIEIGEFGDVTPLQENKTKFQKVKENVTTFVVDKGTKGVDFIKKINWVDDLYKAIPNPELSLSTGFNAKGKFNPLLFGQINIGEQKGSISLKNIKEGGLTGIENTQQKIKGYTLGKENLENIPDQRSLKNIQSEYQSRFESKYYNKIASGETTFETASAEFEKSTEAKQLKKNYEIAYTNEELKLKQNAGFGRKAVGFLGYGGLELSQKVLGLTPTGAKEVVVTGALAYGGYNLLTKIPASVIYGSSAVSGGVGTYQALNPLSSFEKASMGTTSAVLSAGILSYGAYKYLRSPVVDRVKIPFNKNIKADAVGDLKINYNIKYGDDLTKAQKVAYNSQKLGYQSFAGYRSVVTTKGRFLTNKLLNFKMTGLKVGNLYDGIPIDKVGYAKSFKRLTDYGYTTSQAKGVLRYSAPQLINTKLLQGEVYVNLNKQTAVGRFKYETTKPVVSVNKELGINTRGGRTITDNYIVQRELSSEIRTIDKNVVNYDIVKERITRIRSPSPLGKSKTEFYQKSYVASSDLKDLFLKVDIQGLDYGVTKSYILPYKFQNLGQVYKQQQILPYKRKITAGTDRSIIREINVEEKDINIFKITKTPVQKAIKTRIIQNMNSQELKQMIKDVQDIYKTPKPYKWSSSPKPTPSPSPVFKEGSVNIEVKNAVSQYAGTGLYERTESFGALRSAYIPPAIKTDIKSAILLREFSGVNVGMKSISAMDSLFGLKTISATKSNLQLKASLKENLQIREIEKLNLKQELSLRQVTGLKSSMRLANSLDLALKTPNINILKTPTYRPPKVNATPFFFTDNKKREARLKKQLKKKVSVNFALLPDFTARSVGLGSEEYSIKDIEKQLLKVQTGGEIRTGGRIKWE